MATTPKSTTARKPRATTRRTSASKAAKSAAPKSATPKPENATPKPAVASKAAATRKPRATAKPKTASTPRKRTTTAASTPKSGNRLALTLAGLATAAAAAIGGILIARRTPKEGTVPTDLLGDTPPDGSDRAIEAFRPDPTAPVPASEREAFRPALGGMDNSALDDTHTRELAH